MLEKLNEKDQKTVKMGGLALLALLLVILFYMGYGYWNTKKLEYNKLESNLRILNLTETAHKKLLADVPVFQEPVNDSDQKKNFRDSLDKLFVEKGISIDPLVPTSQMHLRCRCLSL